MGELTGRAERMASPRLDDDYQTVKKMLPWLRTLALTLAVFGSGGVRAEQHRATHLGNLSTRFAPTLVTAQDLRDRFADPKLRPDFITVLRKWGWKGDPADLFAAAATNSITPVEIPVGATMPFMSSREFGDPVCLRNVLWAGEEPISAFAFTFVSRDRAYRCVTPKPCSNFFVEDLGLVPKPLLSLDCSLPEKVPVNRPFQICLTVRNAGNGVEPHARLAMELPAGTTVSEVTSNGTIELRRVSWEVAPLAPGESREVCAKMTVATAARPAFHSTVTGQTGTFAESTCDLEVFGIPAILLEKADDPDPVAVGATTTYTVKVTNQGTAEDANVQVVVVVAPELTPVSASAGTIAGQTVTLPVVPTLAPKAAVTYTVVAKGVKAGDGHTKFLLSSTMLKDAISAEESTTVY